MDRAHRLGQTKQAREHIVFFFNLGNNFYTLIRVFLHSGDGL